MNQVSSLLPTPFNDNHLSILHEQGLMGCNSRLLFAKIAMAIWFQVSA